ncbi:MAG: sigma-54 dependent transcriptional regulator [Candidatus Binatia bacterium]
MATKILIVDDEPQMRKSLANLLRREGYAITEAPGGKEAVDHLGSDVFDLVITDLKMKPVSGLDLLRLVKQLSADVEVIVVSAFGTIESAVDAMKLSAFDFITKPFQVEEILVRVRNALEKRRLTLENIRLRQEIQREYSFSGIIGESEKMKDLFNVVRSIAETDVTVLIQGETGTGKELIAKAIHYNGPRKVKRFVSINCGALTETLLESELFGHEKGAFTGASAQRKGIFEVAHGGTLLLDEIADISPSTQIKLLRVLQEGEFQRVGGSDSIKVDVRIIAATNQKLADLVKDGRFRQDLYYRLHVFPIVVPPLRERADDIPLLVSQIIEKRKQNINKRISGISPQATASLIAHDWPGNVRELENVIQRMMVVCKGEVLDLQDLSAEIRGKEVEAKPSPKDLKEMSRESAEIVEKRAISDALLNTEGNITKAAKSLGISRATLQNKMKLYGFRDKSTA